MEGVTIRKATIDDAAEIANVHTNSWREAYVGLIPSDFLDDRPLIFKRRYDQWKKIVVNESQATFVAESEEHGVVGFINGKNGREEEYSDYVEVWCIYLLKAYHGKKIGYNLMKTYFKHYEALDFEKGYLWVLKDNPTISFYEKVGGQYNGKIKKAVIAGKNVEELCYVWDNLSL